MDTKKISFSFNRVQKKQPLTASATVIDDDKKQFIDCLEGKSIKLKDHIDEEEKPLVIPLRNKSTTAASLARIATEIAATDISDEIKNVIKTEPSVVTDDPSKNAELQTTKQETIDEQAARELLEEAKNEKKEEINMSSIPVSSLPTLTGESESSLEDYESIPVANFGLAMLRGMGWQPGKGIGKKNESVELALPKLRPKGMGLGADKVPKAIKTNGNDSHEEELKIVKGAFIKIITGKKSGSYGQITGFDEDSCRIIAKMAISGENVNISELIMEPVTKDEYNRNSRILNASKYEIYKRKDDERRRKHDDERRRKDGRRQRDD